ncbi:MAG: ABC transporter ATP-binding protein [Spirochaetales bacterium]|nr:ABC transporter ATP-binding protein [Spirochaetales bacterium]
MNEMLRIENIRKTFSSGDETLHILNGVHLSLNAGETISITGESGSGKSTLLHILGGLDTADSGSVYIDGTDITQLDETSLSELRNRKIGFIFQSHYLLEEFDAVENVMLPFLINTYDKKEARRKATELLVKVGLGERLSHHPSKLSGGERQRIAIARAFMNDPSLILADEPTGNLDAKNAQRVAELLFDLSRDRGHALIIVTHSLTIAAMSRQHYVLHGGLLVKEN